MANDEWDPNPIFQCGDGSQHDVEPTKKYQDLFGVVEGKWFFWTETWADLEGPFDTKEGAEKALQYYIDNIL